MELSLGQSKGGNGRFKEVSVPILFFNYFGPLITDHLIMKVQLVYQDARGKY